MRLEPRARRVAMVAALAATMAAVYWATGLEEEEVVTTVAPAASARTASSSRAPDATRQAPRSDGGGALDLARLQRAPAAQPGADLFGQPPAAIAPPPPPVERAEVEEVAPPPPPPTPPPLPFRYMGQLAEADRKTVFLAAGDRNLVVGVGDVIDDLYRVDEIGMDALMLTYLPMNVQQTLPTGAVQ